MNIYDMKYLAFTNAMWYPFYATDSCFWMSDKDNDLNKLYQDLAMRNSPSPEHWFSYCVPLCRKRGDISLDSSVATLIERERERERERGGGE